MVGSYNPGMMVYTCRGRMVGWVREPIEQEFMVV